MADQARQPGIQRRLTADELDRRDPQLQNEPNTSHAVPSCPRTSDGSIAL
jgi:hypothetical protein